MSSYDDSGTYGALGLHRPRGERLEKWATWATRALICALVWFEYQQLQTLETLEVNLAVTNERLAGDGRELARHDQQLNDLWRNVRDFRRSD